MKILADYWMTIKDWLADWRAEIEAGSLWVKVFLVLLVLYLVVALGVGIYWSDEPEPFDVKASANAMMERQGHQVVTGVYTANALAQVARTLLEKPGGFLYNDISPPGLWLDNIPNWEYGALVQMRDLSKVMRDAFSRSQSQSLKDTDLDIAQARFHFDYDSWAVPPSESEYREGIKMVESYLERLSDPSNPDAQFFSRADNLRVWLGTVEKNLGDLSQRLSASVGQRRLNTDLANEENASQATYAPSDRYVKTDWDEIDDVFYEARGGTWALIHFLKAVEKDFDSVLRKKNAVISLQQIIRELESAQQSIASPIILNGSGFGFFANHSLVMASYISRANAAIIDLRELLSQG